MAMLIEQGEIFSRQPFADNFEVVGTHTYLVKAISQGGGHPEMVLVFGRTRPALRQSHIEIDVETSLPVEFATTIDAVETEPVFKWEQDQARREIVAATGALPDSIEFLCGRDKPTA